MSMRLRLIHVQGKFVDDPACHLGSARTKETRKYRQYMNRTTGYDDKNVKPKKPSTE